MVSELGDRVVYSRLSCILDVGEQVVSDDMMMMMMKLVIYDRVRGLRCIISFMGWEVSLISTVGQDGIWTSADQRNVRCMLFISK